MELAADKETLDYQVNFSMLKYLIFRQTVNII